MKNFIKKNKIKITIFIMILILALCCIPPIDYNSKNKLEIETPYGDNEAYHPKVLNFKEPWNGYKYWMSYTPYPTGDDSKENPCIAVSNDLVNWKSPTEKNEPLDVPYKNVDKKIYNSDSHIVYNEDLDRLECYWRMVDDEKNQALIYRRYTTDGINWSKKEISVMSDDRTKLDYVSPAILYDNGIYRMWFENKNNTFCYCESKDALKWSEPKELKLNYGKEKVHLWHLDIIKNNGKYEMISVAYTSWKHRNEMCLYYSSSTDGFNWSENKKILSPTSGTKHWDNKGIYRSTFIYENGKYCVFYGGTSMDYHHGVGLVYGEDILNLKPNSTNYNNEKQNKKLVEELKQ